MARGGRHRGARASACTSSTDDASSTTTTTTPVDLAAEEGHAIATAVSDAIAAGDAAAYNATLCPGSEHLAISTPPTPVPDATLTGLDLTTRTAPSPR